MKIELDFREQYNLQRALKLRLSTLHESRRVGWFNDGVASDVRICEELLERLKHN